MEWYVAREGQAYGPVSFDDLLVGARDGTLRGDDLVWCTGMADWRPASAVPELWVREPIAQRSAEAPAPQAIDEASEQETSPHKRRKQPSIIVRHWRGELTLAQAYWGIGFLLTFGAVALGHGVGAFLEGAFLGPRLTGIVLVSFLSFLCVLTIWQVVGTWRSAGNHIATTKRYFWASAARFALILGVLRATTDFVNVIGPMLSESSKLAVGVEDTPSHSLRLLRDGTELELAGGMPFGTAAALKGLLDAAPTVKVIHLNSIGGRLSEGYEIHKLVRQHKLITYTSTDCLSACTIAFLAGGQRYLASSARLGFHSATFGGLDQNVLPEINSGMKLTLRQHAVEEWFIERALATRGDNMWYPTQSELVRAGVVTKIVDAAQFALSGIPVWRDKEALERVLVTVPLYAVIRDNDPEGFAALAKRFTGGVQAGRSTTEIAQEIQATLSVEVLPKYLKTGPDTQLVAYWNTQIAEMEYLGASNPRACVEFLFPELRQRDFNLLKLVPEALAKQDVAALAALIRATVQNPNPRTSATFDQDMQFVVDQLSQSNQDTKLILSEPIKYANQPKILCSTITTFYKLILRLPPARSAAMLRELMAK